MRNASWKIEFPDIYKQIRLHYPPELANESSLIFLACKENLINSDTYLNWAHRYYAIALIVDQFFTQNFDRTVFAKYADLANWSEEFYPVYEWDDVVFVACMDPYILAKLQLKIAIRPLLASYENLVKGWHIINKPAVLTHPETTLHEDFESIEFNVDSQNPEHSVAADDALLKLSDQPEEDIQLKLSDEVEGDHPLKLSDEADGDDLLKLSDESEDETSSIAEDNLDLLDNLEPIEQLGLLDNFEPHKDLPKSKDYSYRNDLPNDNEQTQMPEGLFDGNDETIAPPTIRRAQALASVGVKSSLAPKPPPVPPAPLVPPPPSAPPMLAKKIEKKLEKKIAPQFPPNFPQIPDDATNVAPSETPMAVQSVVSNENPVNTEKDSLSKPDLPTINGGLLPTIKETLNHAYKYYNRIMILTVNSNETLTPIYWDQNFKQKNSTHAIPLYQPSPFRIAYKTAKPFHGPVNMNQILENFVKEWLNDHPIHLLTIVPLLDNNSNFALLLGIADNDIDLKDSLNHFVQIAQYTTKQIINSVNTKVA